MANVTEMRVPNGRTNVVFVFPDGKTVEARMEGDTVVITAGTQLESMNPVLRVDQLTPSQLIVTPEAVPVRHLD